MVNLVVVDGINVRSKVITVNVRHDLPGQSQFAFSSDNVDLVSFRLRNSAGNLLDLEAVLAGLGGSGGGGINGQAEGVDGTLQGIGRFDAGEPGLGGEFARVEGVTEGENLPVAANVHIEVRVVDVETVDGLLEVEVRHAVGARVVILRQTEGRIAEGLLDELGSSGLRVGTPAKS